MEKNKKKIYRSLINPIYWRPNIKEISKDIKFHKITLYNKFKRLKKSHINFRVVSYKKPEMYNMKKILVLKKEEQFIEALTNPIYWKPNFTKISKDINEPISTIFDHYNRIKDKIIVRLVMPYETVENPILETVLNESKKENSIEILSNVIIKILDDRKGDSIKSTEKHLLQACNFLLEKGILHKSLESNTYTKR